MILKTPKLISAKDCEKKYKTLKMITKEELDLNNNEESPN